MPETNRLQATPAPHSWDLEHWPSHVYPHTEGRARWLLRVHRDDLVRSGVLTRIGRELVVLGDAYTRWLQGKSMDVVDFQNGVAQSGGPRITN